MENLQLESLESLKRYPVTPTNPDVLLYYWVEKKVASIRHSFGN